MTYQTDREFAEQLVISPLTVRTHIEHLSEKPGVIVRRAIVERDGTEAARVNVCPHIDCSLQQNYTSLRQNILTIHYRTEKMFDVVE